MKEGDWIFDANDEDRILIIVRVTGEYCLVDELSHMNWPKHIFKETDLELKVYYRGSVKFEYRLIKSP